jgi:ABC-type sugar transport system ATPase subunit
MKLDIIVGGTGTGKTTEVKRKLSLVPNKRALLIYDVNKEYTEFYDYELIDFIEFTEKLKNVKKSVIVFEEATIFLGNKQVSKQIIELIVRKRHTGNYIIMVFHSLRAIPNYIYDIANYLTLFKTNDAVNRIDQKFKDDNIISAFNEVKNNSDKHFKKVLVIN